MTGHNTVNEIDKRAAKSGAAPPRDPGVDELCGAAGLDPATFRNFGATDDADGDFIPPRGQQDVRATDRKATASSRKDEPEPRVATDRTVRQHTSTYTYRMVDQLGRGAPLRHGNTPLSMPVVGLFSCGGGVGKSTLCAALGAAIAGAGRHCLLLGQASNSALVCFYGGLPGSCASHAHDTGYCVGPVNLADGSVTVVSGDLTAPRLMEGARELMPADKRVRPEIALLDATSLHEAGMELTATDIPLMLIRPDTTGLLAVDCTEQLVASADDTNIPRPWYIVNGHDASFNLHERVTQRLHSRLGPRLLPWVVPADRGVEEALACGSPPVAPYVTPEYVRAIDAIRHWLLEKFDTRNSRSGP